MEHRVQLRTSLLGFGNSITRVFKFLSLQLNFWIFFRSLLIWSLKFTGRQKLTFTLSNVNHKSFVVDYTQNSKNLFTRLNLKNFRASLVAQWLRICLPMQGTRVRALVWEDPTCHGATRPVSHSY